MSAEREESLAEYAMRVTLERDEALRQLRAAEKAMWEHIAGCPGYNANVSNRQRAPTTSAVEWARLAMSSFPSEFRSWMEEDKP